VSDHWQRHIDRVQPNRGVQLLASAGAGEIVASNSLLRKLPAAEADVFEELAPVDARNVGRIKAWRLGRARFS
jgi:hypothetical protein